MKRQLKIGDLAAQSGCAAETIRYYEREGLLPEPVRTTGNYRLYSQAHADRLAFIRNCRLLDMTLDEIRGLLDIRDLAQEDCGAAHELIDDHIAHVSARVVELKSLERQLRSLRKTCTSSARHTHCAILDDLGRAQITRVAKGGSHHVKGSHR